MGQTFLTLGLASDNTAFRWCGAISAALHFGCLGKKKELVPDRIKAGTLLLNASGRRRVAPASTCLLCLFVTFCEKVVLKCSNAEMW
jgi:hypothetical protein